MIIRILLLFILFFLLFTLYDALKRALTGGRPPLPKDKSPEGEDTVRDPQCGTFVPQSTALVATIRGKRHYFCSKECRDAFKEGK